MKTAIVVGLVLAFFPSEIAHSEPGPLFDPPFALLSTPLPAAPAPFSLTGLNLPTSRPAPIVPGSPLFSPLQAAQAAKDFVSEGYSERSLKVRCFSYSSPEQLVNWASPGVTFLKELNTPRYHGLGWQVHFVAPKRPDRANIIEMPGNDFDIFLTWHGKDLGVAEACD